VIPIATNQDLIVEEVRFERRRQDDIWGQQNHDLAIWIMILTEEVGEAAKEACDATFPKEPDPWAGRRARIRYRQELIQVAAVAVAMIESLDRNQPEEN
jgi:NTP pyrophosphatase (non-canonical NTP hydrolase)